MTLIQFQSGDQTTLRTLVSDDCSVLFLGDAIMALLNFFNQQQIPLYYRQTDADSRGLTRLLLNHPATAVTDEQWVELTLSHARVVTL